ncbi:MAG: hypothetical protein FJ126_03820 [Deltaproteobacteria bacterium]|nr:hypothetical protein [Deltaproteobacteria bacterium]
MERKTKVSFQGREIEVVEVDFKVIKEEWNEYDLADGTRIRLKVVATSFARALDEFDNDGNPVYIVKTSNVLGLSAPENLKRGSLKGTKETH